MASSEDDPRPACDDYIRPDEFEPADAKDIANNDPCKYCFPDEEIDVPDDELLVSYTWEKYRRSVHRHERTGELEFETYSPDGNNLATALRRNDGDLDAAEVQEFFEGGDA